MGAGHPLTLKWLGIDTYQEAVIYLHRDCEVCRSEGFEAQARVRVEAAGGQIVATLNVVDSDILAPCEAGLSVVAWRQLRVADGDTVRVSAEPPLDSLVALRGKIYGRRLDAAAMRAIVDDIAAGRYANIYLAAFVAACAGGRLDVDETVALTRAMVDAGQRLDWGRAPIADKHCVGGLPGNRTTPIVVAIATAAGLTMPKTSSRAITSPAGTADTMETMAPVELDLPAIRRVVEREGGCVVWGGAVGLSPADDMLIRVERPLGLDSEGQLVASVLSKKVAAGATHALIDIPVGPTAKVRSPQAAALLMTLLEHVAATLGLSTRIVLSDGAQPVGRGVGPALEARDVLAVLRREAGAPADLAERALMLSGALLEFCGAAAEGTGIATARGLLDSGRAWRKFLAIADAQGGFREPPRAAHVRMVDAPCAGRVGAIDNRLVSRIAKLAGAPRDAAAGLELFVKVGDRVDAGAPLYALHAESPGELDYAFDYLAAHPETVVVLPA
ncbi:thymidine phosphorylase [Crenobacter luteus]|uniref:thymidine phosphorylase family protein n=1 Tax=Crenobacter luteus TaxID=1452487 RepID=UPI00104F24CF|nr:thymidine phosphorylase family protein [Crenobacter luteus]TCP14792.1 thymidine phosphorylase [Crenobacter luteus]